MRICWKLLAAALLAFAPFAAAQDESSRRPALADDGVCVGSDTLTSGNYFESHIDIAISGRGPALQLSRAYNSRGVSHAGVLGPGWTAGYADTRLTFATDEKHGELLRADGSSEKYSRISDSPPEFVPLSQRDLGWVYLRKLDGDRGWGRFDSRGPLWLFNAGGWLIAVEDEYGSRLLIERESDGFPRRIVSAAGEIAFSRHAQHRERIGSASSGGLQWSYEYDEAGRFTRCIPPGFDEKIQGPIPAFAYRADGRVETIRQHPTDAQRWIQFTYTPEGWLKEVRGPGARRLTLDYVVGKPEAEDYSVRMTDADGVTRETVVLASQHKQIVREPGFPELVHETDADGVTTVRQGDRTLLVSQPGPTGLPEFWHDQRGVVHAALLDPMTGLPANATDIRGSTRWSYDLSGGLAAMDGTDGSWRRIQRDDSGLPTATESNNVPLQIRVYNEQGRTREIRTGQAEYVRKLQSDDLGRVTRIDDSIEIERTAGGEVATMTVAGKPAMTQIHDAQGRVIARTIGGRAATRFEYEAGSLIERLLLPEKMPVILSYSPGGRIREIDMGWGKKRCNWNASGQIESVELPDGVVMRREYDKYSRIKTQTYIGPAGDAKPIDQARFQYGSADELIRATDSDSDTHRIYDGIGQLISEYQSGLAVSYRYQPDGRRAAFVFPDGKEVAYRYGRTETIDGHEVTVDADKLGAVTSPMFGVIEFFYNADHRLERTRYATINAEVIRTYDATGQISTIRVQRGDDVLWLYSAERDEVGKLKSEAASDGWRRSYQFEPGGWLRTAEGSDLPATTFSYDDAANLLNTSGADATLKIDVTNQAVMSNGVSIDRDAGGRQARLGAREFRYDADSRLAEIAEGEKIVARYRYDATDRLLSITTGDRAVRRVYDGWNLVAEYTADSPSPSAPHTKFVHAGALDEPLVLIRDGKLYFYVQDARGSVVILLDQEGKIAARYSYQPYGAASIEKAEVDQPFRFAGSVWDSVAQVYHMRMRAYDPVQGRFLQPDPIDFRASTNLYAYANNDPLGQVDPLGLAGEWLEGVSNVATDYWAGIAGDPSRSTVTRGLATVAGTITQSFTDVPELLRTAGEAAQTYGALVTPIAAPVGRGFNLVGAGLNLAGNVIAEQRGTNASLSDSLSLKNLATASEVVTGLAGKTINRVVELGASAIQSASSFQEFAQTGETSALASGIMTATAGIAKAYSGANLAKKTDAFVAEYAKDWGKAGGAYQDLENAAALAEKVERVSDLNAAGLEVAKIVNKFRPDTDSAANEITAIGTGNAELDKQTADLASKINMDVTRIEDLNQAAAKANTEAATLDATARQISASQGVVRDAIAETQTGVQDAQQKKQWLETNAQRLAGEEADVAQRLRTSQREGERLSSETTQAEAQLAQTAREYEQRQIERAAAYSSREMGFVRMTEAELREATREYEQRQSERYDNYDSAPRRKSPSKLELERLQLANARIKADIQAQAARALAKYAARPSSGFVDQLKASWRREEPRGYVTSGYTSSSSYKPSGLVSNDGYREGFVPGDRYAGHAGLSPTEGTVVKVPQSTSGLNYHWNTLTPPSGNTTVPIIRSTYIRPTQSYRPAAGRSGYRR